MNSRSICFVLLPIALMLTACQPEMAPLSEEDVAAINDVVSTYQQAAVAGDWDAWVALWSDNAVYMIPNQRVLEGRAAIREMAKASPPIPDLSVTTDEIDGRADIAFVRGTYSFTMPSEGEVEPTKDVGKYLWIVRKQPNGTWQVVAECYNSDLPIPEKK